MVEGMLVEVVALETVARGAIESECVSSWRVSRVDNEERSGLSSGVLMTCFRATRQKAE
jgi:hypothetical protein